MSSTTAFACRAAVSRRRRRALARWLTGRGFQPTDEPILFDLDAESERSAFLVCNERWTLVFFSHWEEERRLIREFQNGLAPLLYLWVYDSDVWGWDLFDGFGFAGSFCSDKSEHCSFAEQEDEPRPPGDAAKLCDRLRLDPALAAEIRRIEKRQASFKEDVCQELCNLLGAPPALSSYDELESGQAESLHEGWQHEQVLYFHYPVAKAAIDVDLDLHAYEPGSGLYPLRRPPELSAEMRKEMEHLRRRARFTMLWLKPITAVAGSWVRVRRWLRGQPSDRAAAGARRIPRCRWCAPKPPPATGSPTTATGCACCCRWAPTRCRSRASRRRSSPSRPATWRSPAPPAAAAPCARCCASRAGPASCATKNIRSARCRPATCSSSRTAASPAKPAGWPCTWCRPPGRSTSSSTA